MVFEVGLSVTWRIIVEVIPVAGWWCGQRDSCAVQYLTRANKMGLCCEIMEFCWSNQSGLMKGVSFLSLNASASSVGSVILPGSA